MDAREKCEFMSAYGANDEDAPHSFPFSAISTIKYLLHNIQVTTKKCPGLLKKCATHNSPLLLPFLLRVGSMYFLFYFNWKNPIRLPPFSRVSFPSVFFICILPMSLALLSTRSSSSLRWYCKKNSFPIFVCVWMYSCLKMYT